MNDICFDQSVWYLAELGHSAWKCGHAHECPSGINQKRLATPDAIGYAKLNRF
jgi:hypothetical protein